MSDPLTSFIRESNMIEGIMREPSKDEIDAARKFLERDDISVEAICQLQAVFAPGKPLRDKRGMNVRVGAHVAPLGDKLMGRRLEALCGKSLASPWAIHVEFEVLHPFMDGNGRTGRILWAWMMRRQGYDPFALSFLHRFYYQTLAQARAPIVVENS